MRALVAWVVVLAAAATASAESRPRYGGVVEGALLGAPATFDPPLARAHAEQTCIELVFDTLFRIGPDGDVQPHLALALPTLDAGKARIAIRPGVKFHDGTVLTAADVALSLDRVRTTQARWITAPITAIRADGDTVELTLKAAVDDLAGLLALPQTAITKGGKAPGERPVGSGPFAFDGLDRKARRLVLRAFDEHFAGRPYLDQLVLRWYDTDGGEARQFETGDAQLSTRGATPFTNTQPKFRAAELEGPTAVLLFVGFGRAHMDVTADRSFRRALDRALARGTLERSVGSGERVEPARVPLPIPALAAPLDPAGRTEDLAEAKRALDDAARRVRALDPVRLPALRLEILVDDTRPEDAQLAEKVARALSKLKINSVITPVPALTLRDRVRRGDCDLWIGQLAAPVTANAAVWWGAAFAAGSDPWAEQQLAAGTLVAQTAHKAFADRLPIVPLAFRGVRVWYRTDVRGLDFDSAGQPGYADLFLYGDPVRAARGKR